MYKRVENKKGITLISLVVTIIILLIIAGIAISVLTGEDGIISKTELAKKKYEISEAKEKLEFAIENLRIEQEGKGEELRRENLPKLNNNEIDVGSVEAFPVEVICGGYKFSVDENFVVTYLGEANRTIITYTTNPEGYTNQDEIQILIKIKNDKGIKEIKYPNDTNELIAYGKNEVGIDYKVTANGTYTFKVIDNENDEVVKDIVIDKIDKLEPLDFTPEVIKNGNSITIKENGKDAEPDGISTKSGIDYYEYYLKAEKETKYTKYETNKINDLEIGRYQLYLVAYDRAKSSKKSSIVDFKISMQYKEISVGYNHCLAIDKNGKLFAWGKNETGQLGDGTKISKNLPIQIMKEKTFIQISAGVNYSLAIDSEGNIWSWGSNNFGQLGHGSTNDSSIPLKIINDRTFIQISAGENHSLALDSEGKLWSWGYNNYGQLGDSTAISKNLPVQIMKEKTFIQISAGENHSLAIDSEENLWSWGGNSYGQLGDGTTINKYSPERIKSEIKFKQVIAKRASSQVIDNNGNLLVCGYNYKGKLGDGTESNKYNFVHIQEGVKFEQVVSNDYFGVMIDINGNTWASGYNSGQLGIGTYTEKELIPVLVKTSVKFKVIKAGGSSILALDNEGNLYAWGSNYYGQYGNGTNISEIIPIQI